MYATFRASGVTKVVKHLPSKHKALNSNPVPPPPKKKKKDWINFGVM
jgi:hypothetical protein